MEISNEKCRKKLSRRQKPRTIDIREDRTPGDIISRTMCSGKWFDNERKTSNSFGNSSAGIRRLSGHIYRSFVRKLFRVDSNRSGNGGVSFVYYGVSHVVGTNKKNVARTFFSVSPDECINGGGAYYVSVTAHGRTWAPDQPVIICFWYFDN